MSDALIKEMAGNCLVTRARLISRVVTGIYDEALRGFEINSPQFILLVIIAKVGPATRSALARFHQQDRSTLSRNLQIMLDNGWIEETSDGKGRSRPLSVTGAGRTLLQRLEGPWRESQSKTEALLGGTGSKVLFDVGDALLDPGGLA